MSFVDVLDHIPLPALFVSIVVFVYLAIALGMRLARISNEPESAGASIGSVVGAMLGLLAFMLAFTFNMTANRFDERKQLIVDEANAIGTLYLRAGVLPGAATGEARELLREYVDLRLALVRDRAQVTDVIARSSEIQDELWAMVDGLAERGELTVIHGLYLQSLNETIDLQAERVAYGLYFRIPGAIWFGLYAIAALTMVTVGYQAGKASRRQLVTNLILAMTFSAVIILIADLDRAAEGSVMVDIRPFVDLQERIGAPNSGR